MINFLFTSRIASDNTRYNDLILFIFNIYTDNTIKVRPYSNDTALTKMSELFMGTHGEWALRQLDIIFQNFTKGGIAQCKLVYMVRKHLA